MYVVTDREDFEKDWNLMVQEILQMWGMGQNSDNNNNSFSIEVCIIVHV